MITTSRTTTDRITSLDFRVEAQGIDADPVNLLLLAHTARDLGIDDVLVSLMIDESEPAVARVRAYARVAVQVSAALRSGRMIDVRELQPAC